MNLERLAKFPIRAAWAVANRGGWLIHPDVGTSPHLDAEALRHWRNAIANTDVYLEYGSGGSTVEAAQSASHVFSVETDERYLAAVARRLMGLASTKAYFHAVHVDIGLTEKWGFPLFTRPSAARLRGWSQYSSAPWEALEKANLFPNFIFVDGRFRAASVLESLIRLPEDSDCLFMLDDFAERAVRYSTILPFITDVRQAGRALLFRRADSFSRDDCGRLLVKGQLDPE